MSSLAAALAEAKPKRYGPCCTMGTLIAGLNDIDRQALINALRLDSGITGEQIAEALRAEGYRMGGTTVRRHRNGKCDCESR